MTLLPATARAAALACFGLLLTACGTESDKKLQDYAQVIPPANLSVVVSNAVTGDPIAGAEARFDGDTATTAADGKALFSDIAAITQGLVHIKAAGFTRTSQFTTTAHGTTAKVSARLLPVGATTTINPAAGGGLSQAGTPAQATIPANVLVDAAGTPVTATTTLELTTINLNNNISSVPGAFATAAGEPLEGFGTIQLIGTAGGADVSVATGSTITIRVPYTSRSTATPPATMGMIHFDDTTGHWVPSTTTATLQGTAPNQYYEATVDQLGTWMAGKIISPSVTLSGCVVNEGSNTPAANVRIQAEGITYSGLSYALTDAAGKFSVKVKSEAASQVIVNGVFGSQITNSQAPVVNTSDTTMGGCLVLYSLSGAPRITLSWGQNPTDIDSHIFAPDGTHVYYSAKGSLNADPFVALDVDDVTSYGPEVVTISKLMVGTYTYGTRLYAGTGTQTASPARVELRLGDKVQTFTPPAGETGSDRWWTVFKFTVAADCTVTVTGINAFSPGGDSGPTAPALPAATARTYCTAP